MWTSTRLERWYLNTGYELEYVETAVQDTARAPRRHLGVAVALTRTCAGTPRGSASGRGALENTQHLLYVNLNLLRINWNEWGINFLHIYIYNFELVLESRNKWFFGVKIIFGSKKKCTFETTKLQNSLERTYTERAFQHCWSCF